MSHVLGGYLVVSLTNDLFRIIPTSERKAVFVVHRKSKRHHCISDDPSLCIYKRLRITLLSRNTWNHMRPIWIRPNTCTLSKYIRLREKKSFANIDHYFNNTVHNSLILSLIFSTRKYMRINGCIQQNTTILQLFYDCCWNRTDSSWFKSITQSARRKFPTVAK